MLVKMCVYIGICLILFIIRGMNITFIGVLSSVVINISYLFISIAFFANPRVFADIPGNIANIVINYFLFNSFGEFFLRILGV